jgi:hypothetical protein
VVRAINHLPNSIILIELLLGTQYLPYLKDVREYHQKYGEGGKGHEKLYYGQNFGAEVSRLDIDLLYR